MEAEVFLDTVVLGTSEAGPGREFKINADSIGVHVGPYVQNAIHKKCRLFEQRSLISESNSDFISVLSTKRYYRCRL